MKHVTTPTRNMWLFLCVILITTLPSCVNDLVCDQDSDCFPDQRCLNHTCRPCHDMDRDGFPGTGEGCLESRSNWDCDDKNPDSFPGAEELCDGLDNNCDGQGDETLQTFCYTGPEETKGVGLCRGGEQFCTNGVWGSCQGERLPTILDSCDGLDNDCDNDIDEDCDCADNDSDNYPGTGTDCDTNDVNYDCDDRDASIHPNSTELCDNFDNNCNGLSDEYLTRECYDGPPQTIDVGRCRAGVETCIQGGWSDCEDAVLPGVGVICDGIDNDCDSETDEADEGCNLASCADDPNFEYLDDPCQTGESGLCASGTWRCVGSFIECKRNREPTSETCGNMDSDDNCDNIVDNIPELGDECESFGTETLECSNGVLICPQMTCGGTICPVHPNGLETFCNDQQACEYTLEDQEELYLDQIYISPGTYQMGFEDDGLRHEVNFEYGFFIGKYEITVAAYQACQRERPDLCSAILSTEDWNGDGWGTNSVSDGRSDHPQNGLTREQAQQFCRWQGGRLPSEAEWEYAAASEHHRIYPWGSTPATCNQAIFDPSSVQGRPWGCDNCNETGCSGTQPVGSRTAGMTVSGIVDMSGNLREWVGDSWHDNYDNAPTNGNTWSVFNDIQGITRGGAFNDTENSLRVVARVQEDKNSRKASIGGRCVVPYLPKPVVLLLIDSSGSMSYKSESESSPPICRSECQPGEGPSAEKSRLHVLQEVLTGSFKDFYCCIEHRTLNEQSFDHFQVPLSVEQDTGLLDTYADFVNFGLMTFDSQKSPDPNEEGEWSYGTTASGWNLGARNQNADTGALIPVRQDFLSDILLSNEEIQNEIRTLVPFGTAPIAALLADARFYFENEPKLSESGDPFYHIRKKYIVLITNNLPAYYDCPGNTNNNDDCHQYPYGTGSEEAQQLYDMGIKTYVIGFDVDQDTLLQSIALEGGTYGVQYRTTHDDLVEYLDDFFKDTVITPSLEYSGSE